MTTEPLPASSRPQRPRPIRWGLTLARLFLLFLFIAAGMAFLVWMNDAAEYSREGYPISRSEFWEAGRVLVYLFIAVGLTTLGIVAGVPRGRRWAQPLPALWWLLAAGAVVYSWAGMGGHAYSGDLPGLHIVFGWPGGDMLQAVVNLAATLGLFVASIWYFYRHPDANNLFRPTA